MKTHGGDEISKEGGKMFRNLNAEQARYNVTNTDCAEVLGISRVSYERKKKTGTFTLSEAMALCKFFKVTCEYLFQKQEELNGEP